MNPATGMVNVPSWFWAEGYDGRPLAVSQSWSGPAGGGALYIPTTVTVTFRVQKYTWNFGDGGQFDSRSLGQPFPAESDIRNAYAWSSRTEPGGVFHGALFITWDVSYTITGGTGGGGTLPPVTLRVEWEHAVQQSQPVVTNP
jgi:hypothetical protein